MELLERRSLSQQVNDLLLHKIANLEFKSGQRLQEGAIAKQLGVSRTPVREALKALAAAGFVTAIPHRGVFVREIDHGRLVQVLDIRCLFELHAAERGIERVSQDHLRKMRSLIEECESILESSDGLEFSRYVEKDCDLHRLIIEIGGESLLAELYERLAVFLQMARVRSLESRPSIAEGHEEHKAMVEAYEARDRDRLLQVLESHLKRSREEILEVAANVTGE